MGKNTKAIRLRGPDAGCRKCKSPLILGSNWSESMKKYKRYWCNPCYTQRQKDYAAKDPDASKKKLDARRKREASWTEDRRERERVRSRNASLKKIYGITVDQYNDMLKSQGGKCKICFLELVEKRGRGNNQVHLDHCHATGVVRGILCGHCNRMLGMSGDRAWVLRRAADYISAIKDDKLIPFPNPNARVGRPTEYCRADHKLASRKAGGKKY